MIVLLTLYPIVMLEQMFLNPLWDSLSLDMAEAIFIGNQLSVAATGFLLIPLAPPRLRVVATPEAQRFMGGGGSRDRADRWPVRSIHCRVRMAHLKMPSRVRSAATRA
jgi:hypothetical protein